MSESCDKAKLGRRGFFGAIGAAIATAATFKLSPKGGKPVRVDRPKTDPAELGVSLQDAVFVTTVGVTDWGRVGTDPGSVIIDPAIEDLEWFKKAIQDA